MTASPSFYRQHARTRARTHTRAHARTYAHAHAPQNEDGETVDTPRIIIKLGAFDFVGYNEHPSKVVRPWLVP
jgi:hypothetical protein